MRAWCCHNYLEKLLPSLFPGNQHPSRATLTLRVTINPWIKFSNFNIVIPALLVSEARYVVIWRPRLDWFLSVCGIYISLWWNYLLVWWWLLLSEEKMWDVSKLKRQHNPLRGKMLVISWATKQRFDDANEKLRGARLLHLGTRLAEDTYRPATSLRLLMESWTPLNDIADAPTTSYGFLVYHNLQL